MTTRERIVRQISVNRAVPEQQVKDIIAHAFNKLMLATKECNSLEISGMGSFIFNKVRAKGELIRLECTLNAYYNKLNTEELSEKKLHSLKKRIENCEKDIEWLKNKLK